MSKLSIVVIAVVALLGVAVGAPAPAAAQLCEPLDNGRMATPFYEGTAIFWQPEIEYRKMVLTINGPCEEIVKTFGPKDTISFDLREIERVTDGTYRWQLSRESNIDEGVQEELQASRGTGEEDAVYWNFFQKGLIPEGPYFDSGSFTVVQGEIVDPNSGEEKRAEVATKGSSGAAGASVAAGFSAAPSAQGATGGGGGNSLATKDFVIIDDLIVDGSACIGFDCVNGESFGFDTIRLKENNLRIKFDDTSTAASFPRNDWQITANDSANGGASKFSIDDISGSRTPFTIEANAPSHSLYVDDGGRVGFGTSTPSVELHSIDGDTPALRLQQDGSSGFAPQTWDIAGNETNFFVRDVTNGSTLPFRIRPGAPSSSIFIDVNGEVGLGTSSPTATLQVDGNLHVGDGNTSGFGSDEVRIPGGTDDTSGNQTHFNFGGDGRNYIRGTTILADGGGNVGIGTASPAPSAMLDVNGAIYQRGSVLHSDYVFEPDYELESIEEHASFMWEKKHLPALKPRMVDENGQEIVEIGAQRRGILEELEKAHIYIEELHGTIQELKVALGEKGDRVETLEERLGRLEAAVAVNQ